MPRRLIAPLLFLVAFPAAAQIVPDAIGPDKLAAKSPAPVTNQAVWTELGLQESGQGSYEGPTGKYTLTLYRLEDATSALAAFDWQRPADSHADPIASLAAEDADGATIASGNYLLVWKGHKPSPEELNHILLTVPKYQGGNLPTLPGFVPATGVRPNSQRYIVGPATLKQFFPEISPATAAFHLSAEAETAVYGKDGGVRLGVFAYPTFEMARKQLPEFEKIRGAMVKRTGTLIAVTIHPSDPNEAERVLSRVKYQAAITTPEKPPTQRDNPVNLLLNIALLVGILIVFCTISGLAFGALRQLFRRFGPSDDGESIMSLHLQDR